MRKFRVWWENKAFTCEDIDAETAEDAKVIATINFSRLGFKVEKMEALHVDDPQVERMWKPQ